MLALLLASVNTSHAQKWAVKSNLLYDATATINLGVEAALGHRVTLDVSGNYNPWKFGDARWKHWLVQPEVRYWLCESFNGHFFGLHAHYAEYNAGGIDFSTAFRHNRYQGHLYGAGIVLRVSVADRETLESRSHGRRRVCPAMGPEISDRRMRRGDPHPSRNYFGPTKIGLTLIFIIK